MKQAFLFLIITLAVLIGTACGGKRQNVSLRLTPTERSRIDTLYSSRLDSLRPVWDSLCEARYADMVKRAVDSIVVERLEEEERLRARINH